MQIPESKLETHRGKTIGIGRVKIPKTRDFNYEIPLLSFIVIEKESGGYVSSCIHLQVDGYGKNIENARRDMLDNILHLLDKNFNSEDYKEHCWKNLLDLFETNEDSGALWDRYHAFQVMLAERGCATDQYSLSQQLKEVVRRIDELESRVKELEGRVANLEDQGGCGGNRFVYTLKATNDMPIVEYVPVQSVI